LGTLQNKAIKAVTGATYTEHATPSYVELNVLKLPDLFRYKIAKLILKILRNNHPPNFSNFFIKTNKIHNRTIRLASKEHALYIPRYKTEKLQKSFKYQGVKVWNSITVSLQILTFTGFKKIQANVNQQIWRHKLGS